MTCENYYLPKILSGCKPPKNNFNVMNSIFGCDCVEINSAGEIINPETKNKVGKIAEIRNKELIVRKKGGEQVTFVLSEETSEGIKKIISK